MASSLRTQIVSGQVSRGSVLPSEAALSRTHRASRITVRKALDVLRSEGLVDSRQGFGWIANSDPVRQSLGRFTTIEAQMSERGVKPGRKIISARVEIAEGRLKEILGEGELLVITRINLADGNPFARVTVWVPAQIGAQFSIPELEEASLYDLLGERGNLAKRLSRAVQTIVAIAIDHDDAKLLGVPRDSPALWCERITYDEDGGAKLYSVSVFPGHKTEFVTELVSEPDSIAPSGLRLVQS
ncbi:GntR family transcriptional regulator [Acidithrix ferrooxidans]|uniref:GntR family transcriptional regulator n=1 Tax=Acidithrix ferrooxidans TaxID=1280514 RepID=UPI0022861F97|nr:MULTISPECIES: GntR family transcriptional regulator [Acidithrix]